MQKSGFLFFWMFIPVILFAQPFENGTNLVSLGIGMGGYSHYHVSEQSPWVMISYERGIAATIGNGNLGLGILIGGRILHERNIFHPVFPQKNLFYRYTLTPITLRLTYHNNFNLPDEWDFYTGLDAGVAIYRWILEDADDSYDEGSLVEGAGGLILGGRYFLSETVGIYLEFDIARHLPYTTLGLTARF